MKKDEVVNVKFEWNNRAYQASVYKFKTTAVVLPNKTILVTNTHLRTVSTRRRPDLTARFRCIFDVEDNLIPLSLLHRPGNADIPSHIKFPLVFATDIDRDPE